MSVPILYAGSLYRPRPFVPIPTPASTAPHFVSAEIGNVDNSTVVVTFDRDVQANENDYLFGVTITFNGIPTGLIAGFRQANHAVIRYSLVAGASSTDVLTWAYSGAGFIVSEADSTPLADVAAQAVTNNVAPVSFPSPNGLDYFKLGEPLPYLRGKVNSVSLDYFKLGEPFAGLSRTT